MKIYKRQIDEAESIAATNLGKFRKLQNDIENAEERAEQAETQLTKVRCKNRTTMSIGRSTSATFSKAESVKKF